MRCRSNKKTYATRKKAWKASLEFFITRGWRGTPYKCPYCTKFHLTHHFVEFPKKQKEDFNKWFGAEVL